MKDFSFWFMELAKYFNCFDLTTVNPTTPKIFSEISKNSRESSQKVRRLDSIKQKSDYPYSETKSIANSKLEWIEEFVGKATKSINVGDYDGVSSVNQSIATNSISGKIINYLFKRLAVFILLIILTVNYFTWFRCSRW